VTLVPLQDSVHKSAPLLSIASGGIAINADKKVDSSLIAGWLRPRGMVGSWLHRLFIFRALSKTALCAADMISISLFSASESKR
jgi:hypothetical protein